MKKTILSSGIITVAMISFSCTSCKNIQKSGKTENTTTVQKPVGPDFNADSAYVFTATQCDFGPRTMNSDAHEKCLEWIISKFNQYGCEVKTQKANLKGYDGTTLRSTNIIASYNPASPIRIILCAHWDSRPWADNDPDPANHRKPVPAANDGASGVAVMIEIARVIQKDTTLNIGIDFVCFDAEDWGIPEWETQEDPGNTWALGSQHFAKNMPKDYDARFGIVLDMVGGEGAMFYREGMSKQYANTIVNKVWKAANAAGYGSFFPDSDGGYVTDDHVPMNEFADIPTIDIIAYYPDCQRSSFGPTWHTISDDMSHIDKNTLKAVGQTIIQVIYTE